MAIMFSQGHISTNTDYGVIFIVLLLTRQLGAEVPVTHISDFYPMTLFCTEKVEQEKGGRTKDRSSRSSNVCRGDYEQDFHTVYFSW